MIFWSSLNYNSITMPLSKYNQSSCHSNAHKLKGYRFHFVVYFMSAPPSIFSMENCVRVSIIQKRIENNISAAFEICQWRGLETSWSFKTGNTTITKILWKILSAWLPKQNQASIAKSSRQKGGSWRKLFHAIQSFDNLSYCGQVHICNFSCWIRKESGKIEQTRKFIEF